VLCHSELKDRYEELRSQALSRLPGRSGLELLTHRGMAAWIEAWRNYTPPAGNPAAYKPMAEQSSPRIPADIVMVIAGMLMACGKEQERDE